MCCLIFLHQTLRSSHHRRKTLLPVPEQGLMIDALFPGEPERMVSIENQFRAVALPGDHFTLHVWKTGENEALFRMVKDSDGKAILDYGRMTWK